MKSLIANGRECRRRTRCVRVHQYQILAPRRTIKKSKPVANKTKKNQSNSQGKYGSFEEERAEIESLIELKRRGK